MLPQDFPFVNSTIIKSDIKLLIETIIERYPSSAVAATLDGIKELGFKFATRAGLSIGLDDVRTPADKPEILAEYERHAPVSRQRVALWEALDLLTVVLRCWTKVKPRQLGNAILMLEAHLSASGLI